MSCLAKHLGQSIWWAIIFQKMLALWGTLLPSIGQQAQVWARESWRGWRCCWNLLQWLWACFLSTQHVQLSYSWWLLVYRSLGKDDWNFLGTQQPTHFNASIVLLKKEGAWQAGQRRLHFFQRKLWGGRWAEGRMASSSAFWSGPHCGGCLDLVGFGWLGLSCTSGNRLVKMSVGLFLVGYIL